MASHLKLKVTKTPKPESVIAAKKTKISGRMMRKLFGACSPKHQMAVLLPGTDIDSVEVQVHRGEDDLMALADTVRHHPATRSKKGN